MLHEGIKWRHLSCDNGNFINLQFDTVKLTHYYHSFNGLILSSHSNHQPKLVNMFLEIIKVMAKVFIHEINRTNVKQTVFTQKHILLGPRKEEKRCAFVDVIAMEI